MIKTITYNPETHVIVPREPSEEMLQAATADSCWENMNPPPSVAYRSMLAAAPQPEPNPNWCAGCSPDNCSGCGGEPAAYIFKPNNELLWPNEVDQNVFASDPEDYDLLYTTPQPDRVAELEAVLKVARDNIHSAKLCEVNSMSSRHEMLRLMNNALAKINEVLHD